MEIRVLRRLEEKNQAEASEVRALLGEHCVYLVNVMGSPGCGKTTLLERILPLLSKQSACGVLEGDLYTTRDAERIAALGAPVVQLETQGSCHLEAGLVLRGLAEIQPAEKDFVFVENVGNLVCPANFDLGESARIAVMSVTEGHDKPSKYPLLFSRADAIVISKTDLLEHTNFDMAAAEEDIRKFNAEAPLFSFSCRGHPPVEIVDWLATRRQAAFA
jgi:hydrogenase nickel incorporation protein HypB